ncbi:alpha/beta hydrolase family protein [Sphingomonas sp. DT-51]|uniref:alpha/beta hydrolase family protein n=1 Tax=Sphingomonas sp. DT-51 TaxID=3396165 RepID=UPI003F19B6A7
MRRSGWNVLTIHYRGAWSGPGSFSFAHCLDDAEAALAWLQQKGREGRLRIDPARIALVGHSMGGFVAANVASSHPEVLGAALLSGVDLGEAFGQGAAATSARSTRTSGSAPDCISLPAPRRDR